MMPNIFNIFDPSSSMYFSLNWCSILFMFFFLPYQFWLIPSRFIMLWILLINFLLKEFKILINYSFSNLIIFISLFIMIFLNNILSLNPYIFTISSHLSFSLTLSLTMWLSIIIYSLLNHMNNLLTHLTPQGTPIILMPFMVVIETISLIIRPITLAIRLTANMIAGHLLLSLLGSSGNTINNIPLFIIMMITQILLLILEIGVAIIQAYVFSILTTLYSSEI